jgi:uncharacterized protein (TIGR02246 family)
MKALAMLCGMAAIALAMSGCNQSAPVATLAADTHDADVKAISDNETQWNQDYVAKDLDKIAAHYADDAVLMTPGAEAVSGKDALRAALKELLSDPAASLTFKASKIDVSKSGELGYAQGSYKMTVTDPKTHKLLNDHGSYVTAYRKQADGSWKAEADIATSAVPPPAPPKHKLF